MAKQLSDRTLAALFTKAEDGNPISGMSPDQVEQWIQDNVTDLASAKSALKKIGRILALHQKYIEVLVERSLK